MPDTFSRIVFDNFEFDLSTEQLWCGGRMLPLTPKGSSVLRYLVERPNQLVTKETLFSVIWEDAVVGDPALTMVVTEIRRVLDDNPRHPRFIKTIHRRGYQFIAATKHIVVAPSGTRNGMEVDGSQAKAPFVGGLDDEKLFHFVGREREFAKLDRALGKTLSGQRQLVFVTGEPGIGKTTLVDTFAQKVSKDGKVIIGYGQCIEHYGKGEPYLPVLDTFGQFCRSGWSSRIRDVLKQYAPTWLVQLPALFGKENTETFQRESSSTTHERMLREMAECLEALASDVPVLICLEDLHWSDYATLDLLSFLARRRSSVPLMIVGTFRPVEVILNKHPLREILQELKLHKQCIDLPLAFLSEEDVKLYLDRRFPLNNFPASLSRLLHRRTDGNPLFLVHAIDNLVERKAIRESSEYWELSIALEELEKEVPENLKQMVEQQFSRLNPQAQQLVEAASVVGEEFSAAAVAAGTEKSIIVTEQQCAELARKSYMLQARGTEEWPDGTVATRYSFVHALHRGVIYEEITAARRIELHQRIGERLEIGYRDSTREIATQLAVHFERARNFTQAIFYLQQAGENSEQRGADQDAAQHFTRALDLLKTQPASQMRNQQEIVLLTALGAPLIAMKGYASPEVGEVFTKAKTLCQDVNDLPQMFPVLWGLCAYYAVRSDLQTARELGEQLVSLSKESQDKDLCVAANLAVGGILLWLGEYAAAHKHLDQGATGYDCHRSQSLAHLYGYDPGIACHSYSALTLWSLGYIDQAHARVHNALRLAQNLAHPHTLAHTHAWASVFYQHCREVSEAQHHAETAIKFSKEHDFLLWDATGCILRGWSSAAQGNIKEEINQIQEGISAFRRTGAGAGQIYFPVILAEAYGCIGCAEEGVRVLNDVTLSLNNLEEQWWKPEIYRVKGDLLSRLEKQEPVKTRKDSGHGHKTNNQRSQPHSLSHTEVEDCFLKAIALAQRQGAKSLELRAVTRLARFWQQQGKRVEAHRLLAEIYHWFTEGSASKDLQEAKALLDTLA